MIAIEPTARQRQLRRVLSALRLAYPGGVCMADVADGYVLRNRVGDLQALGWRIASERCARHDHRGPITRYYLQNPNGSREGFIRPNPSAEATADKGAAAESPSAVALRLFDEPYVRSGAAR